MPTIGLFNQGHNEVYTLRAKTRCNRVSEAGAWKNWDIFSTIQRIFRGPLADIVESWMQKINAPAKNFVESPSAPRGGSALRKVRLDATRPGHLSTHENKQESRLRNPCRYNICQRHHDIS